MPTQTRSRARSAGAGDTSRAKRARARAAVKLEQQRAVVKLEKDAATTDGPVSMAPQPRNVCGDSPRGRVEASSGSSDGHVASALSRRAVKLEPEHGATAACAPHVKAERAAGGDGAGYGKGKRTGEGEGESEGKGAQPSQHPSTAVAAASLGTAGVPGPAGAQPQPRANREREEMEVEARRRAEVRRTRAEVSQARRNMVAGFVAAMMPDAFLGSGAASAAVASAPMRPQVKHYDHNDDERLDMEIEMEYAAAECRTLADEGQAWRNLVVAALRTHTRGPYPTPADCAAAFASADRAIAGGGTMQERLGRVGAKDFSVDQQGRQVCLHCGYNACHRKCPRQDCPLIALAPGMYVTGDEDQDMLDRYVGRPVRGAHRKPCAECGKSDWSPGETYYHDDVNPYGTDKFCHNCFVRLRGVTGAADADYHHEVKYAEYGEKLVIGHRVEYSY